ncbi:MAG: hydrogenase maturation nickel metallochaperone HypA [bacterium]|nr:hydrogenase maturation nickel metallochaperone HypA [bacterium]
MHELYIAQCILKSVAESLPENVPAESVNEVRVQVGQLDAVVPDTLVFLFDAIKSERGMKNARLVLDEISVLCRCRDCGCEFSIEIPLFLCPDCGHGRIEILRGRGITLTAIHVNDESDENENSGHS